eukprot:5650647-Pleurochrysis_carterae.AAC.1
MITCASEARYPNAELVTGAEVRQQLHAFLDERKLITTTLADMANRVQKLEDAALRDQNQPSFSTAHFLKWSAQSNMRV